MKIKKNSLLLRIIFYNDIAIVLLAIALALTFSLIVFDSMERRLYDRTREKTKLIYKAYTTEIKSSEYELYSVIEQVINSIENEYLSYKNQDILAKYIYKALFNDYSDKYENIFVAVLDKQGNIIGEKYKDKTIKKDIEDFQKLDMEEQFLKSISYNMFTSNNNIYVKIVQSVTIYLNKEIKNIVLVFPISNYSQENISKFAEMDTGEGYFLLTDRKYIHGNFSFSEIFGKNGKNILNTEKKINVNEDSKDQKYTYLKKKINNEDYLISIREIKNNAGEIVANIGTAISITKFLAIKYMLAMIIIGIVIIAIIISTTLCAHFFTKLLSPLSELAEKASNFGVKDSNLKIEEKGLHEIRILINSVKNMASRIEENEKALKENNQSLQNNLNRIIAIEKILMGIDVENDFISGINVLLKALTSEIGLAYSRALYFEYDEETQELNPKQLEINNAVRKNLARYTSGVNGFKFQIENVDQLLSLLKVPFKEGNLFYKSIKEGRIVYHNEKGYKFDFGNDLFKAIGISNFMILPLSDDKINKGAILLDYFGKNTIISKEEVEVMTLLLLNLIIRVKNKESEEDKIIRERLQTVNKVSNKFLSYNKKIIPGLKEFIYTIKKDLKDLEKKKYLEEIEKRVKKIEAETSMLDCVVEVKATENEAINIADLAKEIINDIQKTMDYYSINVSLLVNFDGKILGHRQKLYQMFIELIKNSIDSLLSRNKVDKKINIVISGYINDRVIIEVIDNGIGMTKEEATALKEAYFSSLEGSTLGFGLATVYKIVREHRGVINITSELDEGTRVKLIFNVHKEEKK